MHRRGEVKKNGVEMNKNEPILFIVIVVGQT